jgi:hypothetical protein
MSNKIHIDIGDKLKFADECYVILKLVKKQETEIPIFVPAEKPVETKVNKKKAWAQSTVLCKECLCVSRKSNMHRHKITQKHLLLTDVNTKLYKPEELRLKIIELEKLYNLK